MFQLIICGQADVLSPEAAQLEALPVGQPQMVIMPAVNCMYCPSNYFSIALCHRSRHGNQQSSGSVVQPDGMLLRLELVRISISRHAIAGKSAFHTAVEVWQPQHPPAAPSLCEIPAQVHGDAEETSTCPVHCCWWACCLSLTCLNSAAACCAAAAGGDNSLPDFHNVKGILCERAVLMLL